ncbi:hypothetical protein D3C77_457160 [compost metagenome]
MDVHIVRGYFFYSHDTGIHPLQLSCGLYRCHRSPAYTALDFVRTGILQQEQLALLNSRTIAAPGVIRYYSNPAISPQVGSDDFTADRFFPAFPLVDRALRL